MLILVHDVGIEPTQLYLVRVAKSHSSSIVLFFYILVVPIRFELMTYPLSRECSTAEPWNDLAPQVGIEPTTSP